MKMRMINKQVLLYNKPDSVWHSKHDVLLLHLLQLLIIEEQSFKSPSLL